MAAFYSNSNVDNSHNWPLIVEVRQLTAVIQSKSKIITDDLLTIMDILPDEILVRIFSFIDRVRTGPGKPGKSWNFVLPFSRTGKSWKMATGPGNLN